MEVSNFCQSCSMPMDKPELAGTEHDGSKSNEYCIYCYQEGNFRNPGMTLGDMKKLVREQMEKRRMDAGIINRTLNSLPNLRRWRKREFSL